MAFMLKAILENIPDYDLDCLVSSVRKISRMGTHAHAFNICLRNGPKWLSRVCEVIIKQCMHECECMSRRCLMHEKMHCLQVSPFEKKMHRGNKRGGGGEGGGRGL